jgi:hypothetical protein
MKHTKLLDDICELEVIQMLVSYGGIKQMMKKKTDFLLYLDLMQIYLKKLQVLK